MITFPNAKINLGLDILRKRDDGYHDIETVMVPVPWRDILEIVPAKGEETTLTVTGRTVACPAEKNLVMKAYRALGREVSLPPVDIFLRKIIPDGAGLGGGSADAAYTLRMLNDLFALDYSQEQLAEIAATLGADCPFFIYDRPMLCTATGTELTPLDVSLQGWQLLIVKPQVSVPTAAAYGGVTPHVPSESVRDIVRLAPGLWQGRLVNGFEQSVFLRYPAIAEVKERLEQMGAVYASMSGSGAAVYGLFEGDKLSDDVRGLFAGCDTMLATL